MESAFPPELEIGARVWTDHGFRDHGPMDGPKQDIAPNMGGEVLDVFENAWGTGELYEVCWDNGQKSVHYPRKLLCIGRFRTRREFEAAIQFEGPVELTLGPQGGFRGARLRVRYDGETYDVELEKGEDALWRGCLEPIINARGAAVQRIELPAKPRVPPGFYKCWMLTTLQVRVDSRLYERLRAYCLQQGRAADKVVKDWIVEKLREAENDAGAKHHAAENAIRPGTKRGATQRDCRQSNA